MAIPFNNFKDQVMIAANSGDAADVIMGNDQMMSAFNGAQILQPLEGVLDQAVIDDLIPVYKEATMYDGKLCSVAWMPHPVAMFYNKDLFAKAGLDPEAPPKTWDEMIEAIAKISALGEDETETASTAWRSPTARDPTRPSVSRASSTPTAAISWTIRGCQTWRRPSIRKRSNS